MKLNEPRTACVRVSVFEDKIAGIIDNHVRVYESYNVPMLAVVYIVKGILEGLDTLDVEKIKGMVFFGLKSFNIYPMNIFVDVLEPREMKNANK